MKTRTSHATALTVLAGAACLAGPTQSAGAKPGPTKPGPATADAVVRELRSTLGDRVREGWSGAIVAGVLGPDGRTTYVTAGRADGPARLGADSVFEAGSLTKTFTATLLADAVERGEVTLKQPVAELLPAGATVPAAGARQITLEDLATQTSGLPRLPANLIGPDTDPLDPYAGYTRQKLLDGLAATTLTTAPGTAYAYSNFGFGLLGDALSIRLGAPYAQLVQDRIAGPLSLASTGTTLTAEQGRRFVPGHDGDGNPVPAWSFDALAGAGALRSTAADLLRYAKAGLAAPAGPGTLGRALAATQTEHWSSKDISQGLAWVRQPASGRTIVWHNGGTGGHQSFLGLDPARGTAVVILSDTGGVSGVTDLGLHALDRSLPLDPLPHAVALPKRVLDRYAGTYRVDGTDFVVTRDRETLVVSVGGQRAFVLRPSGPKTFFSRAVDAQVTFAVDRQGRVSGFEATVDGETSTGTRRQR